MRIKDLTFDKIQEYDPFSRRSNSIGMVTLWVARNIWGNAVAFGDTKKECLEDARRYVRAQNAKEGCL